MPLVGDFDGGEPERALNPIGLVVAADSDITGQLCEAVHTGLRKGAFGDDAHKIWKVIADSETEDWWDGIAWAVIALKSEGYVFCKPGEVAGAGAGAVVGAAQAWSEGYVAGYDEGNERNTGPMPEGVNPYE
jgi:hypothetical protein